MGNGAPEAAKENGQTYVAEKKDQITHEVINRLDNAARYVHKKLFGTGEATPAAASEIEDLTKKVDKLTEMVAVLTQELAESKKSKPKV